MPPRLSGEREEKRAGGSERSSNGTGARERDAGRRTEREGSARRRRKNGGGKGGRARRGEGLREGERERLRGHQRTVAGRGRRKSDFSPARTRRFKFDAREHEKRLARPRLFPGLFLARLSTTSLPPVTSSVAFVFLFAPRAPYSRTFARSTPRFCGERVRLFLPALTQSLFHASSNVSSSVRVSSSSIFLHDSHTRDRIPGFSERRGE